MRRYRFRPYSRGARIPSRGAAPHGPSSDRCAGSVLMLAATYFLARAQSDDQSATPPVARSAQPIMPGRAQRCLETCGVGLTRFRLRFGTLQRYRPREAAVVRRPGAGMLVAWSLRARPPSAPHNKRGDVLVGPGKRSANVMPHCYGAARHYGGLYGVGYSNPARQINRRER